MLYNVLVESEDHSEMISIKMSKEQKKAIENFFKILENHTIYSDEPLCSIEITEQSNDAIYDLNNC